MSAEAGVSEQSEKGGRRSSQNVARSRRRRRRPNIDGPKQTLEVVMSVEEYAKVQELAAEANMTVPWFLVQSALNPMPAASTTSGEGKPWLSWPRRTAIRGELISATGALDEITQKELAHIGSNQNQMAHAVNIALSRLPEDLSDLPEVVELAEELAEMAEDLALSNAELREVLAEVRERSAVMEGLAREVVRR